MNKIIIIITILLFFNKNSYSNNKIMSATPLFKEEQKQAFLKYGKHGHKNSKQYASTKLKVIKIGDKQEFWTKNFLYNRDEKITAICQDIGVYCYIYADEDLYIKKDTIENIKHEFDNNIYMTATSIFGDIPNPGIDNDPRVTILIYDIQDYYKISGIYYGGYFSHKNEYSKNDFPTSNEREMVNLDYYPTLTYSTSNEFFGILAHEFQHLIHWNHDPLEDTWLDEGCANFSMFSCGYGHPEKHIEKFFNKPTTSLTNWNETLEDYGISYLFISYLADRFGKDIIKKIVDNTLHGTGAINYILKEYSNSFQQIFSDFTITNYANDPDFDNGKYSYINMKKSVISSKNHTNFPAYGEGKLESNSSDYISAQTMIENKIIINFSKTSPNMFLNIVLMKDNKIYSIENVNFKTSNNYQKEFLDFGKDYNKIVLIPFYTGSDSSTFKYSFTTNSPKVRICPNPFMKNIFIFVESSSLDKLSVSLNGAEKELNTVLFRKDLYKAIFTPDNDGYYELYAEGNDINGNHGYTRKIINTKLIFKDKFDPFNE